MQRDPSLDGDPQYVPQPFVDHTYAYVDAYPLSVPTRKDGSWTGWLLAVLGALALAMALLPWATLYYHADSGFGPINDIEVVHGYDGVLGPPTMVLYPLCIALGVLVGLRRGTVAAAISSLVISVVMLIFLLVKAAAIKLSAALESGDLVTEPAYWVALVATCGVFALSIVALARRPLP